VEGAAKVKRAILSDVHANIEALRAVLADVETQSVDEIICLGDVVGYGPNPLECIDLVSQFKICILGNHDLGALFDPEGFSSGAERAIFWTRAQLEDSTQPSAEVVRRLDFLAELPRNYRDNGTLFVHGSPRNPLNEYVFPEDVYNARKIERVFDLVQHVCFQGHTHVPGVFTESMRFHRPDEVDHRYVISEEKCMINVGSVGQPRDGDSRSSYVILDDEVVWFRRVEYPLETTVEKIYAIDSLDNFLGDRLREGR